MNPPRRAPIDDTIISIPIRENLLVRIQGIPFDLTKLEADKLCAIIAVLAGKL